MHAGFAGQAQQVARAVDVGAVHGVGIANPEAVVGGDVDDGVAAGERAVRRIQVGEVADDGVAGNAFEVGEVAGLADEQAEIGAFGGKRLGHMVAYKSGRACKEDFHSEAAALARSAMLAE